MSQARSADPVVYPRGGVEFGRVNSFSDNTAAAAITLLVVNILIRRAGGGAEGGLAEAIVRHGPDLMAYAVTFVLVAVAWRAQHRMTATLVAMNPPYIRASLLWLFVLALAPVAGVLIADFGQDSTAIATYCGWLACLWAADAIASATAERHGLVDPQRHHVRHAPGPRLRGSVVRALIFAVAALAAVIGGHVAAAVVAIPCLAVLYWSQYRAGALGIEPRVDDSA